MNPSAGSPYPKKSTRSPILAAILSFLLPGLGQIYCRQDNKGVFLLGISLLGQWATGGISSFILCPTMCLDAFLIARKVNGKGAVGRWEFFPTIKGLNSIPPRIILLAVVAMIAVMTVIRIMRFAS